MPRFELYGCKSCPHTQEAREWLEWNESDFVEYDVESDPAARLRMMELAGGQRLVPVLAEAGSVKQIGWQGRGCAI